MREIKQIIEHLLKIESLIKVACLSHKETLTFEEALLYTGRSESNMYKLTSDRAIPHYKPNGKMITFRRVELDAWMLRNPVRTADEIDADALLHITKRKRSA